MHLYKTLMENIFVLLKIEIWEWKYQNFDETYFRSLKNWSLGVENKQTRIKKTQMKISIGCLFQSKIGSNRFKSISFGRGAGMDKISCKALFTGCLLPSKLQTAPERPLEGLIFSFGTVPIQKTILRRRLNTQVNLEVFVVLLGLLRWGVTVFLSSCGPLCCIFTASELTFTGISPSQVMWLTIHVFY